jgi:hypothetical protein
MYIGRTVPFANAYNRSIHFARHGHEFGAADEFEYERLADTFMSGPIHADIHECVNPTGTNDRIRLNAVNRHLGVGYGSLVIRTYHVRDAFSISYRGGPAGFVAHKCAEVH